MTETIGTPMLCVDSSASPTWPRAGAQTADRVVPGAVQRTLEVGSTTSRRQRWQGP